MPGNMRENNFTFNYHWQKSEYLFSKFSIGNTVATQETVFSVLGVVCSKDVIKLVIINKIFSQEATSPSGGFQAGPKEKL